MKTIAVIGWKNSGKTTLVSNLVKFFKENKIKVGVVKHAHHSFDIDHPNTDSYKIRKSGAYKTTLVSDKRLAFIEEKAESDINLERLVEINKDCDLLIFEKGSVHRPLPEALPSRKWTMEHLRRFQQ